MAELGNAWHIPDNAEPPRAANMRSPVEEIAGESKIEFFTGNQFRGAGGAADQHQAGSKLLFKKATDGAWSELDLNFRSRSGNNEYYSATIPADTFQVGDLVQYYFRIAYDPGERLITFVHGEDGRSKKTADESAARSEPFSFVVRGSPRPSGPFVSFDAGPLQGRIYRDTGHIQLAGPDLAGTPLATVLTFAAVARIGDRPLVLGRVLSTNALADGFEVVQEVAIGAGVTGVRARLSFPSEGVMRYEVVDWNGPAPEKTTVAAASDGNEHFYGFGEKFNAFDQSGKTIRTVTFDQPADKGDHSYKVAPWFVSTRGYGFHLDSTAESTFDMRVSGTARYSVTNYLGTLSFEIVYGPKLTDVLKRYSGRVGRPPLPPPFAFGPWMSSDIWRNGAGVRYVVEKLRELNIPTSVLVFDSPWEKGYNDFQFNPAQFFGSLPAEVRKYEAKTYDQFASLPAMMNFFQHSGLKVVCWLTPFINSESQRNEGIGNLTVPDQDSKASNFDDAEAQKVFVRKSQAGPDDLVVKWWKGKGSPVDFTKATAREWLTKQMKGLVVACNVTTADGTKESALGGFKPDDGEALTNASSDTTPGGEYIPATAAYDDGRTGREMRNGYCVEYHKTIYGVLGAKGLIFARSGYTGTQAFPGCWAGDNKQDFSEANGLASVIVAGQSAAMSGFSIWSHDIGGYLNQDGQTEAERADIVIRWTQFGCFTPIMQFHRQPVAGTLRQYPWGYPVGGGENFGKSVVLDNYRFYARLHTRLFPYIYTYAKESQDTGLPIIRPLVLLHQSDARTYGVRHAYHFGDEFLVAPIVEAGANGRQVYLPKGKWYEFWTNIRRDGGDDVTWKETADGRVPRAFQFPLYVREGAIIPMLLSVPDTLCDTNYVNASGIKALEKDAGLLFLIYPAGDTAFTVYDGTIVECRASGAATTVKLSSIARPVGMNVLAAQQPAAVKLDGVGLSGPLSADQFDAAAKGWRYDADCKFVRIKFPHAAGGSEIVVT